jgi:RNA polymerase sigma factor (sigma-70 family)
LREPVFRYLRTIGCQVPLAEEITQEVFFRLHRALRDGLQLKDVRAWVFRVARNLFIDSRREHQRFRSGRQEEGEELDLSHTDSSPDPEQQVLERERIRIIQREVTRLPRLLRESMYLRAQGLQYHEIAIALDISITTAVDRVRRAIKKLGRRFGEFK